MQISPSLGRKKEGPSGLYKFFENRYDFIIPLIALVFCFSRYLFNDVTVEHEAITLGVLEKVIHLVDLAIRGTKVHIRKEDGLVTKDGFP